MRARLDVLWFAAAVGLLMAGIVGWSKAAPPGSWYAGIDVAGLMLALWSSGAIILATWWRRSTVPTASDAPLMGSLALAASAPLSLLPIVHVELVHDGVSATIALLTALPLGIELVRRLPLDWARQLAVIGIVLGVVA